MTQQVLGAAAAAPDETEALVRALREATARTLPGLLAAAKAEAAEAETEWRRLRHDRWFAFCTDAWLARQRDIYRWIRQEKAAPVPADSDLPPLGSWQDLQRLDDYWQGLWGRDPGELELATWTAPLAELQGMDELPPLTGAALQDTVRAAGKSKSPGADGWTYGHMALWPDAAYEALAAILRLVERLGEWPHGWAANTVCLLPKGGTRDAGDRRPIVLLSAVYRVWAATRAHPFRRWLRSVGVLPARTRGADEQAGLLGLHKACARGGRVAGLTVDWSKCYDRLPLAALEEAVRAARIPPAVWRPMLAAYRLPRLVRADGLGAPARSPSCGLAPGCPAATDWLALVMHCWTARIRERAPALLTRAYVDDLSAFTTDEGSVADVGVAWEVTEQFGAAFCLRLNSTKSVRWATGATARAALADAPGPPVLASFKDLGVVQRTAQHHGPVRPCDRLAAGYGRLVKCAALSLPFATKLLVIATSAVSSMMFGSGQALLPRTSVLAARRRVYGALTRGRYRQSADAMAVLLDLPWRFDPGAYAVVAPWRFLLGAVADGYVTAEDLAEALAHPRVGGPCAAAMAALRRAGVVASQDGWRGAHGDTLADPLGTPRVLVEDFLHASWKATRWDALRWARRAYRPLDLPDTAALSTSLQADRTAAQTGALRAVLTGSLVTQSVARHWRGGSATCPHCTNAAETFQHRFWGCGRWDGLRRRLGIFQPPAIPSLRQVGLLALPTDFVAARRAAQDIALVPPTPRRFTTAWLDGSAFRGRRPGPAARGLGCCVVGFGGRALGRCLGRCPWRPDRPAR